MGFTTKAKTYLRVARAAYEYRKTVVVKSSLGRKISIWAKTHRHIMFMLLFAIAGTAALLIILAAGVSPSEEVDQINRINAYRNARGLPSLSVSSCLTTAGRKWSQHMAEFGRIHHTDGSAGKDAAGNKIIVHVSDPGMAAWINSNCGLPAPGEGSWTLLAENVGVGGTSDVLFQAFLSSAEHEANIRRSGINLVGVGSYRDDSGKLWITQLFANCTNCGPNWYGGVPPATSSSATPAPNGVGSAMKPDRTGHWVVSSEGKVTAFNSARHFGDVPSLGIALTEGKKVIGMASTASGNGYWLIAQDGGVFSFGDAQFYGSMGNQRLNAPIVAMAAHPSGGGYWFVASDGGVFSFGNVGYYGSMGGQTLNRPIITIAATPSGNGYWLVASDGGIFSFGDAQFYGSTGNLALNAPIIGMAPTTDGQGYWLFAKDGGVFTFGNAQFYGSTGDKQLPLPVVGFVVNRDNAGYYVIMSDGTGFGFGSATSRLGINDDTNDLVLPPPPTFKTSMTYTSAWPMQQNPTNISASYTSAWPQRRNPTGVQMSWYTAWDGGPLPGYCAQIHESSAPWEFTWMDNQLCSNVDLGLSYTSAWPPGQPLPGNCVNINEPAEPYEYTWWDNVICTNNVDIGLRWSYWGNLADANTDCVSMNESSDPYPWGDNYLCWNKYWPGSQNEPIPAGCAQIYEPVEPWESTWNDNVLCMSPDLGLSYTSAHPSPTNLPNNCVRMYEPYDPDTWGDNVLCSSNTNVRFSWSNSSNTLESADTGCVQIFEYSDGQGWDNNYLCWNRYYAPTPTPLSAGCVRLDEPADPDTWQDNVLCSNPNIGLTFSNAWPVDRPLTANCVRMQEPWDSEVWSDNVLCSNTYVGLQWSYFGNIDDADTNCVQISEPVEPASQGWPNYLCWYDPPASQPDLVVSDVTWTPASPVNGNSVSFSATIANRGTAATPDGIIHGLSWWVNGTQVGWNDTSTTSLAPGASRTLISTGGGANGNGTWTAATGSYTVEAFVDDVNRIRNESNETNNKLSKPLAVAAQNMPPSAPSSLRTTSVTASTVSLAWNASTDDRGIAQYRIYRNGTLVNSTTQLTYTDSSGLSPSTSYNYQVFAVDTDNAVSAGSNVITATTSSLSDTTPPSVPGNFNAVATSSSQVSLSWSASTDNVGVSRYYVYRAVGSNSPALIAQPSGLSYVDASASAGTTYTYSVRAIDAAGNLSAAALKTVTTPMVSDSTPPSAPTGLSGVAISSTQVNLNWSSSMDTGGSGLRGYNIIRNGVKIATTTTTSYGDATVTPGTSYTYIVTAYDGSGNTSAASNSVTVTTPSTTTTDTTPPTAPTNLSLTIINSSQVNLRWGAASDNIGVVRYDIYRNGIKIGSTTSVSYGDATVRPNTRYSYYVKAVDARNNIGPASNTVTISSTNKK